MHLLQEFWKNRAYSGIDIVGLLYNRGRKSLSKSNPGIPIGIQGSIPGSRDPEILIVGMKIIKIYVDRHAFLSENE